MFNRNFWRHRWGGSLDAFVQAFRIPTLTEVMRSFLSDMMQRARQQFRRVNWRSPLLLGFALSLIYWIGFYGWMIAEVNFKAFRYAGF